MSFERDVLRRPPSTPPAPRALSGNVSRSDSSGVWVTAQGADENHPSGPCRGATRPVLVSAGNSYSLVDTLLPVGTRVLYVVADDGPWILSWEV